MARPTIVSVTEYDSGNGNTGTTHNVNYPAFNAGDLLIFSMSTDLAESITTVPNGPNGETLTTIGTGTTGSGEERINVYRMIGSSNTGAGTIQFVKNGTAGEVIAQCVRIAANDFNASNPIDSVSSVSGSNTNISTAPTPSWTCTNANGLVIVACAIDNDPLTLTGFPSGWTAPTNDQGRNVTFDYGPVENYIVYRDAATTASETISSVNLPFGGDGSDTSSLLGFVVNEYVAAGTATPVTYVVTY